MFSRTVQHQSHFDIDASLELYLQIVAFLTFGSGVLFVLGSFYRLGIHGIYYADYFGILMSEKATRFPYNVLENPLYVGSTLIFLGSSIHYKSPVGFILTLLAFIMYKFASILENPITELIYSEENIKSVRKMSKERDRKGSIDRNLK
jgi:methylene-fatty-acyl-phospholipid synthase